MPLYCIAGDCFRLIHNINIRAKTRKATIRKRARDLKVAVLENSAHLLLGDARFCLWTWSKLGLNPVMPT